jgi:hypothetical protein
MPEDISNLKVTARNEVYMVLQTQPWHRWKTIVVYFDPGMDKITVSAPGGNFYNKPRTPTDEERVHLLAAVLAAGPVP